jgi:hypothetical protein
VSFPSARTSPAAISSASMSLSSNVNPESLLSYPVASSSKEPALPTPPQARQLLKDRLYVGNLAPTVDECAIRAVYPMHLTYLMFRYTLLQVFSKYGRVSKLDFLFHKSGPHKGKPRGYAFVEYSDENVRVPYPISWLLFLIPGSLHVSSSVLPRHTVRISRACAARDLNVSYREYQNDPKISLIHCIS